MSSRTLPLNEGMYHVCNRAVGREVLFHEPGFYNKFLKNVDDYLVPVVDLWAYNLLPNHFHLLFDIGRNVTGESVAKAISDCCNSYTKWSNVRFTRKGNLFMRPFKRIAIENDNHLAWVIWYIHRNHMHHGYSKSLNGWPYSSYNEIIENRGGRISREKILGFFGGRDQFIRFHNEQLAGGFEKPGY